MNKSEKLAEEWVNSIFTRNATERDIAGSSFLAGWNALKKELLENSQEFDEAAVSGEAIEQMKRGVATDSAYIRGARWQHAQDQLKYQVLFSAYSKLDDINIEMNHRVKELEAELAKLKEGK